MVKNYTQLSSLSKEVKKGPDCQILNALLNYSKSLEGKHLKSKKTILLLNLN